MNSPAASALIENIVEEYPELYENGDLLEPLKKCSNLKFRDLITDTVAEYSRMKNFCRIYPARNSKLYDKYFSGNKALAKIVYKVLHTAEIIPYGICSNQKIPGSLTGNTGNAAQKQIMP